MTAGASLHGARIAITRPDAGPLGARLAAMGASVVHVPLIEVDEPDDGGAALREALARLATFDWLVVTSANAASRVGASAGEHPRVRMAAVGPATAEVLARSSGRPVDLVASVPRADGLVADFPSSPVRVLLAQGDLARPVVAEGLAAAGHDVEVVTAYRTVVRLPSADEVVALVASDAVVLASGSAARAYADAVPRPGPVVVAIGPVTAAAARSFGIDVNHVAPSPDVGAIVELLESVLRSEMG